MNEDEGYLMQYKPPGPEHEEEASLYISRQSDEKLKEISEYLLGTEIADRANAELKKRGITTSVKMPVPGFVLDHATDKFIQEIHRSAKDESEENRQKLASIAKQGRDLKVRTAAAVALGRMGDPRAIETLGEYLRYLISAASWDRSEASVVLDILRQFQDVRARQLFLEFYDNCSGFQKEEVERYIASRLEQQAGSAKPRGRAILVFGIVLTICATLLIVISNLSPPGSGVPFVGRVAQVGLFMLGAILSYLGYCKLKLKQKNQ